MKASARNATTKNASPAGVAAVAADQGEAAFREARDLFGEKVDPTKQYVSVKVSVTVELEVKDL